jgi:hypothetical protein
VNAVTAGRHTRLAGRERRWWSGLPWRRNRAGGETHPYPAQSSDEEIASMIAGLRPLSSQPAFAGASLAGQPDAPPWDPAGGAPDHAAAGLPAPVPPFHAAETMADPVRPEGRPYLAENPEPDVWAKPDPAMLREVIDGLRGLDEPQAFVCRPAVRLGRRPAFLGLAPAGDGRLVAEIDRGGPDIYAWDRAGLDWLALVIKQARDNLVYARGGRAQAQAAAPAPAPAETEAGADRVAAEGGAQ